MHPAAGIRGIKGTQLTCSQVLPCPQGVAEDAGTSNEERTAPKLEEREDTSPTVWRTQVAGVGT